MWMKIKKIHKDAVVPHRAHETDAGLDICCVENEVIQPWSDKVIKTGISMAIPDGWVAIVKERSGNATKKKITVGACVIDSGYRGELMIHLFNNSDIPATFIMGDKIAQLVIVPCWVGQPEEVEALDDTSRGDKGFGSSDDGEIVTLHGDPFEHINKTYRNKGFGSSDELKTGTLRRNLDTKKGRDFWEMVDRVAKQTENWSEEKKRDAQSWLNKNIKRD